MRFTIHTQQKQSHTLSLIGIFTGVEFSRRRRHLYSMVDWTTVLISVVGAGLIDLAMERKRREREEQKVLFVDQEDWYRKIMSISTQLRDEALSVPYGTRINPESLESIEGARRQATLKPIQRLVNDLEKERSDAPGGVNPEVKTAINELVVYFDQIQSKEELQSNEVRQEIENKSEAIRRTIAEHSSQYSETLA
jgi:hypothetical protein